MYPTPDLSTTLGEQQALRMLGISPGPEDGIDGPATQAARAAFQRTHGLDPTGLTGPAFVAALAIALRTDTIPPPSPPISLLPFVQAKNFTPAHRTTIDLIVVHTMESPEKPGTAANVARWFAGPDAPRASAHYCVDRDQIVQCVRDEDVAWHAPGANHNGIGIEHAGYARQTPEEWADDYSMVMLDRSAELAARLCRRYSIPIVWLSALHLKSPGARGITGHVQCTEAFSNGHGHTDPGPHFPIDGYLDRVRRAYTLGMPVRS